MFKAGLPNGEGVYSYSDSLYHSGNFQDGIKEGKGETHYVRKTMPDSIIKGYWSGGEYRGKKYITYALTTTEQFDNTEITPSGISGNTVTVEIGTTSGSPNGNSTRGFVLTLSNLVSPTSSILKTTSKYETSFKSFVTVEIVSFPCKLFGTFSDGQTFELELYKAANWKVRFYKNK
jgi:MORN repeat